MRRLRPIYPIAALCLCGFAGHAQFGRGTGEWSTSGGDAQRASWVRSDAKISPASVGKPGFSLLWKVKLASPSPHGRTFTGGAILLNGYIGYRGFRSLGFIGGGADAVFALDTDLGRVEWQQRFAGISPASGCAGGMTANLARPVSAAFPPLPQPGRGAGRGTPAKSAAGQPEAGAVTIEEIANRARLAAAMPPAARGGAGRGRGAPVRMPNYLYAIASDGRLHALLVSNGQEAQPAIPFLPPHANAVGLAVLDNIAYTVTTQNCGGADAVWALDLDSRQVASWKPTAGGLAGSAGPAIAPDGTVYATTAGGLVALEPKTLTVKESYTAHPGFTSSPVVFEFHDKTLVAAASKARDVLLFDSSAIGKPLSVSDSDFVPPALASWQDLSGTRWILGPSINAIAAFKVVNRDGIPVLEPGWTSHTLAEPLPPLIVNGVVFAVSGGDRPAVLYAFDGATGRELWNSGGAMGSPVEAGGLSAGGTQIYLATRDGNLYAFGFPMEH